MGQQVLSEMSLTYDGLAQSIPKNLRVQQFVLLSCQSAADETVAEPVPLAVRQLCRGILIQYQNGCLEKLENSSETSKSAGFVNRGGKGEHRNFVHPKVTKPVTISGKAGDDAKHHQEKAVKAAIEESHDERKHAVRQDC